MKTKLLTVISAIVLLSTFNNYAYSQAKKMTPAKKVAVTDFHQSKDWKNLMVDNVKGSRDLIMMGSKILNDGNMANEAEKMLMGSKMMISGLEILEHQMHEHSHSHSTKMAKMAPIFTKDVYLMLDKAVDTSSAMLMRMGNKLITEGNTNKEGQKMMTGGELIHSGIHLHHSMEHVEIAMKHNGNDSHYGDHK